MKYKMRRFLAYMIDVLICYVVITCMIDTKILNPFYDKMQGSSTTYNKFVLSNYKLQYTLESDYEDQIITEEEWKELIEDNLYADKMNAMYEDKELSSNEVEELKNFSENEYQDKMGSYFLDYEKSSTYYYVIYIIIFLLYLVVFNKITKGITLGKKIMHLQVVTTDKKEVSSITYLLRSILLYNIVFYMIRVILVYTLSSSTIITGINILSGIQSVFELILFGSLLYSKEDLGIHDRLLHTKVIDTKE